MLGQRLMLYLDVSMCALDPSSMAELVKGSWPQLMTLKMSANSGLDDVAIHFLSASNWREVANVEVRHTNASGAFIRSLMQTDLYLEALDLRWSSMGAVALAELAAPRLRSLDLSGNNLGAAAMAALATASLPQVTALYLNENRLDAAAIEAMSRGDWPRLISLDLSDNHLDNAAMLLIAQGNWNRLRNLHLNANDFDAFGLEILVEAMWPDLDTLVLDEKLVNSTAWRILSLESTYSPLVAGHGYTMIGRALEQSRAGQQESWPKLGSVSFAQAKTRSRMEHEYN